MQSLSVHGNKYFFSFIDDFIRFTVLYFRKKKSGAYNAFTSYKAYVENQCQLKISNIKPTMKASTSMMNGQGFVKKME